MAKGSPVVASSFCRSPSSSSKENNDKVYILTVKARESLVKEHLEPIFPCLEHVPGMLKEKVNVIPKDSIIIAKPTDWDTADQHILTTAYKLNKYPNSGEVACTMGHRRILEKFLRQTEGAAWKEYSSDDEETGRETPRHRIPAALILEDDAIPLSTFNKKGVEKVLSGIVDTMKDLEWDLIQLGRCFDIFCDQQQDQHVFPVAVYEGNGHDKIRIHQSRGFELCSHAYLVSRKGAEKILQYSLPILLPYVSASMHEDEAITCLTNFTSKDHTLMLLGRNRILNAYYTDTNIFIQSTEISISLINDIDQSKPVCDPINASETFATQMEHYDPHLIKYIEQSPAQEMVSVPTRRMKYAKTIRQAEAMRTDLLARLCSANKTQYCAQERTATEKCVFIGGTERAVDALAADAATRSFLDSMSRAGLNGVIIWGLAPDEQHTHVYIHKAIYKAVAAAFEFSNKPMHLCYLRESPSFDLGRDLLNDTTHGRLADSLVFVAPKHMRWSSDPGTLMLPLDLTARYVFHGETPRPHTVLKSAGLAIEHEAWGPDGNVPTIDSDFFNSGLSPLQTTGCVEDFSNKRIACPGRRLLVQPWAAEATPSEIEVNKRSVLDRDFPQTKQREMHFQGTVWACNVENFLQFTQGCGLSDISVVRHSERIAPLESWPMNTTESLLTQRNFRSEQSSKSLFQILADSDSQYAPSFQGTCHFQHGNRSKSYIADRILNVVAAGFFPITNNVAALELLENSSAIVYHEQASMLCKAFLGHKAEKERLIQLMDVVAEKHTYVSRLSSMLDFIILLPLDTHAVSSHDPSTSSSRDIKHLLKVLDTRVLKAALDECSNDIECVLKRVPIHPLKNCSQAVFGYNHQIGEAAAFSLSHSLACAGIRHVNHMSPELYEIGTPLVHFLRDPLEVVVGGYAIHRASNEPWLKDSGITARLNNRTVAKGLLLEYKGIAEWNINNSAMVYNLKKSTPQAKKDIFTIRVEQLDEEIMFNLTLRAIQKWLGVDQTKPLRLFASSEDPAAHMIRKHMMDHYSDDIYSYRDRLEYPKRGLEHWSQPPENRFKQWRSIFIGGILVVSSLIWPNIVFAMFSRKVSFFARTLEQLPAYTGTSLSTQRNQLEEQSLVKRFILESSWNTSWFGHEDVLLRRTLDPARTFCPRPLALTRWIRLCLFLWSASVLWVELERSRFPGFYFAYLSHVTHGLTVLYFFVSLCVAMSFSRNALEQQATETRPSPFVCFYWFLFAAVVTCQFIACTVHWATETQYFLHIMEKRQRYFAFMMHGGFFALIVLEGRYYSRIPLRAKHVLFPWSIMAVYGSWTMFQSFWGPTNPFYYGQERQWNASDDDAIYPHFNWNKRPLQASCNWLLAFVLVPVHFFVLWIVFSYSGKGLRFDGSNHFFKEKRK